MRLGAFVSRMGGAVLRRMSYLFTWLASTDLWRDSFGVPGACLLFLRIGDEPSARYAKEGCEQ